MGKIKSLLWETGSVLPDRIKHDTLSQRENTYFSNYTDILLEYCEDIDVQLTSDIEVCYVYTYIHIMRTVYIFFAELII